MSTSSLRRAGTVAAVLAFVAMLSLPTTAVAQVATGSIVGTVVDPSGQTVPGAQVTVRNVNRNTTTTLVTDASGVYTAPFLVPGTYEVSVELQGFKTWTRPEIVLQVNGKKKGSFFVPKGASERETAALAISAAQNFLGSQKTKKEIVVPGRLVNLVV